MNWNRKPHVDECPVCQSIKLYSDGGSTQLLGYSKEVIAGESHDHDPNLWSMGFMCDNGHRFTVAGKRLCNVFRCDYEKNQKYHVEVHAPKTMVTS